MGIWDKIGSFTGITGDDTLHLQGAHNWLFGGEATDQANREIRPQMYGAATSQLSQLANGAQGRQGATMGGAQLAGGPQDQSRAGMYGVANNLGAIASGQQAGAGELAVNRQVGQATAAQQAAARMSQGANSALAARNAARNTMDLGIQGAGAAAQAQRADQQAALAQQGQLYGEARAGDINYAAQNAQLNQQAQLANLQAEMQQRGMNDQQQIQALGQLLGWDQAQMQAAAQRAQVAQGDKGILAGLFSGGGQALAAVSDERLKTDVADADAETDEFMTKLGKPKRWRYLDEKKYGSGERLGPMVQDMAKSKLGSAAVVKVDDEGHLGYDVGKATSMALASVARLNQRLSKLERTGRGLSYMFSGDD